MNRLFRAFRTPGPFAGFFGEATPAPPPGPSYSVSGPSGGVALVESTDFTVTFANLTGPVEVTPDSDDVGGTFTPTSVTGDVGDLVHTFTYTPDADVGIDTISFTNDGGLTDPSPLEYEVTAPPDPFTLQSLTGLVGEWRFDQAAGRVVHNDASGGTRPTYVNLVKYPEREVNRWDSKTASTVTDLYASGPDGTTQASRIVLNAAAAGSSFAGINCNLTNGQQYTISARIKSNGGGNTFRLGRRFGTLSSNQTATGSWQWFSNTFTEGSGGMQLCAVFNDSSGNAADLQIAGFQVEQAASMSTYIQPGGHMVPFKSDHTPAWVTGGMQFVPANTDALSAIFNEVLSLSTGTIHVCFSADATPAEGFDCLFHGGFNNGNNLRFYARNNNHWSANVVNNVNAQSNITTEDSSSHSNSLQILPSFSAGARIMSFVWDGSRSQTYLNGLLVRDAAFVPGSVNEGFFSLGSNLGTQYFTGKMYYAAHYTSAHDATDVASAVDYIASQVSGRGVTLDISENGEDWAVWEGDSITNASGAIGFPAIANPNLTRPSLGIQAAVIGDLIVNVSGRSAKVDALYNASRRNNILVCMLGANDLNVGGANPTTIKAAFKSYAQARQAVGWKVVWQTTLPTTRTGDATHAGGGFTGFENDRQTLLGLVRGDATWYDALADVAADATIGIQGVGSGGSGTTPGNTASGATGAYNTDLYPDGTHPSAACHAIIEPIVTTAINSVMV